MTTLESKRLILRPFDSSDKAKVFEGLSHPEVTKYYGVSYETLESTQTQMDWFKKIEEEKTGLWRAIIRKEDQTFIGGIGIYNLNEKFKNAELGYWLLPDFWRQGYIKEAGLFFCDYLFEKYDLHRLDAMVETQNTASLETMRVLGFQYEGTRRECELKEGKWIDLALFGKLKG